MPFSEEDWEATPIAVRHFIIEREKASIEDKKTMAELSKRIEELERQIEELLNRDSSNSDQPPSSDGPYRKPRASREKEKSSYWSPPKSIIFIRNSASVVVVSLKTFNIIIHTNILSFP
ncbi:MAG: hypothetical protein JRI31_08300 [Deltaproteobacteria bacterium]|nr:hypothetical protein [Deltaproteobacteria bacterium]